MDTEAQPRRGQRRSRSNRSLTDGNDGADQDAAALVRQESHKEAKRTRRALDDWRAAQAELVAIEAELRSTRSAIAALKPELQPELEPEPEPEVEQSDVEMVYRGNHGWLTGKPAAAVTAAREQLISLRRHHERCRNMLVNPPIAPSPGKASGAQPSAEVIAQEEAAQRKRRAQLEKVEALVASIEEGRIDPEDLVGAGPTKDEVIRDILPVVVPRKDQAATP